MTEVSLSRRSVVLLLDLFRAMRSTLFPRCCRFTPSCSLYAREAVLRKGVLGAIVPVVGRLLRCHPFNPGGYDPVH